MDEIFKDDNLGNNVDQVNFEGEALDNKEVVDRIDLHDEELGDDVHVDFEEDNFQEKVEDGTIS